MDRIRVYRAAGFVVRSNFRGPFKESDGVAGNRKPIRCRFGSIPKPFLPNPLWGLVNGGIRLVEVMGDRPPRHPIEGARFRSSA